MTPWIATDAKGKGDAVGGPTLVGGSHQGSVGYITGPNFCSVIHGLDDPEAPYWGVVLSVNLTTDADGVRLPELTDATTCLADTKSNKCLEKSSYNMPFCSNYLYNPTFCARSFNSLVATTPNVQDYVTALDNHARACVEDTFETGVSFDSSSACHKAVAIGACNNVFPICKDNEEIEKIGPRGVCKNDCILERQMCRTDESSWFSLQSITKFNCGSDSPFVDVSEPGTSLLCSGSPGSDELIAQQHFIVTLWSFLFAFIFFGLFIFFLIIFSIRSKAQIEKMKATARNKVCEEWRPKRKEKV